MSTTTCYATGSTSEGNTSATNGMGMQYSSSTAPYDHVITGCTFHVRTTNTGTDNLLYAKIYDSTGVVRDTSTNGINNNTLSGTTFTEMVFTFAGGITLADGDIIGLVNTNSSTALRPAQTCGMTDADPHMIEAPPTWNNPNTACQFEQCVTYTGVTPPPSTSTTFMPPPPAFVRY